MKFWKKIRGNGLQAIDVFSTSNAIMNNGWLKLSADAALRLGFEYNNHSIGGSSSCYGAFCAENEQKAPFAVYDFLLNDQFLIDLGAISSKQARGQHIAMIRSLIAKGKADQSVVVLLTLKSAYLSKSHDALRKSILRVLKYAGIAFLDVSQELPAWLSQNRHSIDDAYLDDRHFTPLYQKLIGDAVLQKLMDKPTASNIKLNRKNICSLRASNYRKLSVSNRNSEARLVGTSLMSDTVFVVNNGDNFVVEGAKYLAAYMFWHSENSGSLIINGQEKRRLLLRRGFGEVFLFETLGPHIAIDAKVEIEVSNDTAVPIQKSLGQHSSIYDTSNTQSSLGYFVGCDCCPEELVNQMDTFL